MAMWLLSCWSAFLEEAKNLRSTLRRISVHSEAHGVAWRLGRSQMKMLARYPNLEMKKWNCMLLANRSCMFHWLSQILKIPCVGQREICTFVIDVKVLHDCRQGRGSIAGPSSCIYTKPTWRMRHQCSPCENLALHFLTRGVVNDHLILNSFYDIIIDRNRITSTKIRHSACT
jgi:hypothetical protein